MEVIGHSLGAMSLHQHWRQLQSQPLKQVGAFLPESPNNPASCPQSSYCPQGPKLFLSIFQLLTVSDTSDDS